MAKKLSNQDVALRKAVEKREKFLKVVISAVKKILCAHGLQTKHEVCSSHTHVVWELFDFAGFNFYGDFGQTMFGGDEIKITYKKKQVFCVYWQHDLKVKYFEKNDWDKHLLRALGRKKQILEAMKRKEKRRREKDSRLFRKEVDRQRLEAKAKELAL